ncbi:STAS domain-containing protein [Actinoplanes xinjiangensis]|uniref:STAS domain-containing protein n=1 Tax=Actinoplanes xinjiangensis TaxID=512350 RepID=UPI003437C251
MNIQSRTYDTGVVRVSAAGELDMATADDLAKALHDAIGHPATTTVVVDFVQVSFCDSSGIEALDIAYGNAATTGISLRVTNLQSGVRRVLELTGLLNALTGP